MIETIRSGFNEGDFVSADDTMAIVLKKYIIL